MVDIKDVNDDLGMKEDHMPMPIAVDGEDSYEVETVVVELT